MSICDSDSGLSISLDGSHYGSSLVASNGVACFKIEIKVPDLNLKNLVTVIPSETVAILKTKVINNLSTNLKDSMNYGLFIPPTDGKAGKFLLEERPLKEYGLHHHNNQTIELRYKRRLYRCTNINVTKLKKLHSKTNLKLFMEYIGNADAVKVSKFLNKGLDPNFQNKETGETPLIKACSLSQPVEIIKILVEGGAHLDFRHSNGHTPLHAAAILGNLEAVKILLDLGQSPNTLDLEGLTPLYHSIISDSVVLCVERLLYDYSIIGVEDENGLQEIHQACRFGKTQHLECLLQYKADINCQTSKNGNTSLHICAYLNQEDCARLLLFRGADRSIKNRAGHTAYQQALLSDNKNIAMLIQYYKEEDVVGIRGSPKYNSKRRPSCPALMIPRSRSASGISDLSQQFDKREDSGFNSQMGHYNVDQTRNHQAWSLGKTSGQTFTTNTLLKEAEFTIDQPQSANLQLFENRKSISRSVNNLLQSPTANSDTVVSNEDQNILSSTTANIWWCDWENDDTDGISSVSGPSQRRAGRNQNRLNSKKKSRSHSLKTKSDKNYLSGLVDIDTNFLPRIVVLQRNSQGFGFVIRGLKASSAVNFQPTIKHPALQYFEEIESNSVAARAGLKKGDFILEINNKLVVRASHEETVRLIKASGDILTMKVVTISKNKLNEQRKCFDLAMSGMDDSSDQSSIVSSECQSQKMSTFAAASLNRPFSKHVQPQNPFSNVKTGYNSMNFNTTTNMNHCYKQFNSSLKSPTHSLAISTIPSDLSSHLDFDIVRVRQNNVDCKMRPESILSTDSFYPMPPPPLNESSPQHQLINKEIIDDFTLKRSKSYPAPIGASDDRDINCGQDVTMMLESTSIPQPPPPPPPPPPMPVQVTPFLPMSSSAQTLSSLTPPVPPPCPPLSSAISQLSTTHNLVPRPILKQSKPLPRPSLPNISSSIDFDSHLRQAIAKRRQQIDNDQCSVASSDLIENFSKMNVQRTNQFRKNNDGNCYAHGVLNPMESDDGLSNNNNNNTMMINKKPQPSHTAASDVYSSSHCIKKLDENSSRLYLV